MTTTDCPQDFDPEIKQGTDDITIPMPLLPLPRQIQGCSMQKPALLVGTQGIFDSTGRQIADELLFRGEEPTGKDWAPSIYKTVMALKALLLNTLPSPEENSRKLFVNVCEALLLGPLVETLHPNFAVIELLESVRISPAVLSRIQALHQRGYIFALDDLSTVNDPRLVLLPWVHYVKLDLLASNAKELQGLRLLCYGKTILAEKVESIAQWGISLRAGYHLMQGYGVKKPELLEVEPYPRCSFTVVFKLLEMLNKKTPVEELQRLASSDPAVLLRLLAVASRTRVHGEQEINSVAALMRVFPRNYLTAVLDIILIADCDTPEANDASTRFRWLHKNRFLQLLTQHIHPNAPELDDKAFLLGVLGYLKETQKFSDVGGLPVGPEIKRAFTGASPLAEVFRIGKNFDTALRFGWDGWRCTTRNLSSAELNALTNEAYQWAFRLQNSTQN